MDIRQFKEQVFKAGSQAGLEDMEIYAVSSKDLSIRVFEKEVDDYTVSVGRGVGFRARFGGKIGYAYAEALDEDSVQLLVEGAKANAKIIDSDDEIELFDGAGVYPEVEAYNSDLEKVSPEEKIEFAKALEKEAFAADPRVSVVNWANVGYGEQETYIANTKGLEKSFSRNGVFCFVAAVVREEDQVKTGGRARFRNNWEELDARELAGEAVQEAASMLNAGTIKSGSCRVLLRYDVARTLLATFASVFSAEAVQKGLSLLAGKLNEQIANPILTLIDDPLLLNAGASAPFDAEGVPTRTKNVIEKGRLTTYLHNLKTAKKDGVASTGNASRASFKAAVGISPSNFYIQPGEKDYEELIKKLGDGLVIINVQGAHSGADSVSGDFSLGAYGYLVENGKIVRPVDQITVAGNFFELLEDVVEIGSDLEFGSPGLGGNVGSPSVIVSKLAIAGD